MKLICPGPGEPPAQPDPYILHAEDGYWIYATGPDGVRLYRSPALTGPWRYEGLALREPGMKEFWAPCVLEIDGHYYMYYSSFPENESDVHREALKVAEAEHPCGPFVYRKTLLPPFSIDAHVVRTGAGLFLFYARNNYDRGRVGTYIVVDRMRDPYTVEGNPVAAVVPTLDEEISVRDHFHPGEHWHTIEGPFYFRKGEDHFLMYSGSSYGNDRYFVGYATAHGAEEDLRRLRFRKYPSADVYAPLLWRNETEEGTGHNSVAEENGAFYIVYHARDVGERPPYDTRTARLGRLHVQGDRLTVERIPDPPDPAGPSSASATESRRG